MNNKKYIIDDFVPQNETLVHKLFIRPLAFRIAILLNILNIQANYITILRIVFNIVAIFLFFNGTILSIVLGIILFQLHELLDHVDGILARLNNKVSKLGFFLEKAFDSIFSTIPSFFGISITYYLFIFYENYIFFIIFIFISSGMYLTVIMKNEFNISSYEEFSKKSILNELIKIIYVWQNQLLIFSLLFTLILEKNHSMYTCLFFYFLLFFINNISWLFICYKFWNYKNENKSI